MGFKINFLFILGLVILGVTGEKTCSVDQRKRYTPDGLEICCYTVLCSKSHKFKYCDFDGGKDRCEPCGKDFYTNDPVNTADAPLHDTGKYQEEPTLCARIPSCEEDHVKRVDNHCVCDLDQGYYGSDNHLCKADVNNCVQPGHQLTIEGQCEQCKGDTFKPEDGIYRQCRNRTRCKEDEDVVFVGSSVRDRQCKMVSVTTTQPVTTTPGTPGSNPKENDSTGITVGIVISVLIVILLVTGLVMIYRKREELAAKCPCLKRLFVCFGLLHVEKPQNLEETVSLTGTSIPIESDENYTLNGQAHHTQNGHAHGRGDDDSHDRSNKGQGDNIKYKNRQPQKDKIEVVDETSENGPLKEQDGKKRPVGNRNSGGQASGSYKGNKKKQNGGFDSYELFSEDDSLLDDKTDSNYVEYDKKYVHTPGQETKRDEGTRSVSKLGNKTLLGGNKPNDSLINNASDESSNLPSDTSDEETTLKTPVDSSGNLPIVSILDPGTSPNISTSEFNQDGIMDERSPKKDEENSEKDKKPVVKQKTDTDKNDNRRPVGVVSPFMNNPHVENQVNEVNNQAQGMATSDQGGEIAQPTPEFQGSHKVVTNHAPRNEYEPSVEGDEELVVDLPDRQTSVLSEDSQSSTASQSSLSGQVSPTDRFQSARPGIDNITATTEVEREGQRSEITENMGATTQIGRSNNLTTEGGQPARSNHLTTVGGQIIASPESAETSPDNSTEPGNDSNPNEDHDNQR